MEINPRMTGGLTLNNLVYSIEDVKLPITLLHFIEFFQIPLNLDPSAANKRWELDMALYK